jgi:hypothetical protein
MAIIPPKLTGAQVDPKGTYQCPLCRSQTSADPVDTGWVRCPMLDERAICLGCCVDYQAVARAEEFERHPFRDLFNDAARVTGRSIDEVRRRCLEHQAAILKGIPELDPDDEDARAVTRALAG